MAVQQTLVATLSLFSIYLQLVTCQFAAQPIYNAFANIRNQTIFPVTGLNASSTSSSFGPRTRVSTDAYDFHRGVDFSSNGVIGTPVVAALDGTFSAIVFYDDGGLTVRLRHSFNSPVIYMNKTLRYFYTFYMHLNTTASFLTNATTSTVILKGTQIGTVGQSGSAAVNPHLHFEMRVGTQCSLEFQLDNPTSSCSVGYGFDPHMHSMLLFNPRNTIWSLTLLTKVSTSGNGEINVNTDSSEVLTNRFVVRIVNSTNGAVVASHTLDFNERLGFDASTNTALDNPDRTKPYIKTYPFSRPTYVMALIIPSSFAGSYASNSYTKEVTVYNIWGESRFISWTA